MFSSAIGPSMRLSRSAYLPSLNAAWRWWSRELAALVPERWRRRLIERRGPLVLALEGDDCAALIRRGGGGEERLGRLDLAPAAAAQSRAALAALGPRLRRNSGVVVVRVPTEAALRTVLALPLAAAGNLEQVVAFELDRRTPFRSEEVYRSQYVLRRDAASKRLAVQLTLVPRPPVEAALAAAERLGLVVERVEVAGEPASGNLLPPRRQALAARLPRFAVGGLAALALALAGAAVLVPLEQAHQRAATLSAALADSRRRADESLKLEKEIDAEIQQSGFLALRKRETPSASELLDTLTRLLPDDTWLSELEISGGELRLTGFAASASTVLGLVDQSPRFANAAFRSPVTQDPKMRREQFNIAARIVRRNAP